MNWWTIPVFWVYLRAILRGAKERHIVAWISNLVKIGDHILYYSIYYYYLLVYNFLNVCMYVCMKTHNKYLTKALGAQLSH